MPRHRPRPLRKPAAALLAVLAPWLLVGVAPRVSAQQEPASDRPDAEAPADEGEGRVPDIDQILQGDEDVLSGSGGYSYDPGGRRDPFKSLLEARNQVERQGPRPEGVPGLLIDEITVTGIFDVPSGWVAQVRATNKDKSFLIREGDHLYDGEVISIGRNEVVFKQVVNDPTALKPFHDVVKKLNP